MSKVVTGLYLIFLIIFASVIGYSGFYLLDMLWDSLIYTFGKSGCEYAYENFFEVNGRWAQGLTNDIRLYEYKGFSILFSFLFFLFALFKFFRVFVGKKMEALVLTGAFYIALFFTLGKQYYDFTFNLSSVLSYTLGLSLLLLLTPFILALKDFKSQKALSLLLILAIAFLCGLLEIHGILVLLLLIGIMGKDYLFQKRIQKSHLLLLAVAVLSNALVFFSPGNQTRREQSGTTIEFDMSQLLELFLRNLKHLIDSNVLVLLGVTLIISMTMAEKLEKRERMGFILLLGGVLLASILPLLLIVMAAPERAMELRRVENMSFFFMMLFLLFMAYFIGAMWRNVRLPKTTYPFILLLPLASFSLSLLDRREVSESEKTFTQIYFGDLEKYYYREMAIRDYLLNSEKGMDKEIPALLDKGYRHSVIGLPNGYVYKNRQHPTYERLLNEGNKIFLRYDYPDPACFTSIYFFEKGNRENLKKIHESPNLDVYLNEKYNTVLAVKKGESDGDYFRIPGKKGSGHPINWNKERMRYPDYYSQHPDIICLPMSEFEAFGNQAKEFGQFDKAQPNGNTNSDSLTKQ